MPHRARGTAEALRPPHNGEKPWDRKRWNTRFPSCAAVSSEKTGLARKSCSYPKGLALRSDNCTTLKPAPAEFVDGSSSVDDLWDGDSSVDEGLMAARTRHSTLELLTLVSRTRVSTSSSEGTAVSLAMLPQESDSFTPVGEPRHPLPPLVSNSAQTGLPTTCGLRKLPGSSSSVSLPSHSTTSYGEDNQSSPRCCSSQDPNSMQRRLCLLEERVSRIAGDLQGAKGLLDAFNPAWFKAHLAEIQSKISIIETAMILQKGPDSGNRKGQEWLEATDSMDPVAGNNYKRVMVQPQTQEPVETSTEPNLGGSSNLTSYGPSLFAGVRICADSASNDRSEENRHKTLQVSNLGDLFCHDSARSSSGNGRHGTPDIGSETHADVRTELAAVEPMDGPSSLPRFLESECGRLSIDCSRTSFSSKTELSEAAAERNRFCISGEGEQDMEVWEFGGKINNLLLTATESLPSTVGPDLRCQDPLEDATSYILPTESGESCQFSLTQMLASNVPLVDNHLYPQDKENIMEEISAGSLRPQMNDVSDAGLTYQANEGEIFQILQEFSESDDAQYGEAMLPPWTSRPVCELQTGLRLPEANPDLFPLGQKLATAGWFVCEGEGIVLAHEGGACSYYDVANMEEKAEFKCPRGLSGSGWQDCWLVRAAGADGRSNKYVVAASAPGGTGAGFCVWDFEDKSPTSYHSESSSLHCTDGDTPLCHDAGAAHLFAQRSLRSAYNDRGTSNQQYVPQKSILTPLNVHSQRPLWWYRPCGPLLVSAASGRSTLTLYDIRDGDIVTQWNTEKTIVDLNKCSPSQWRNKGTIVVALDESIGIYDVNSMAARCLQSINLPGQDFHALYIPNGDAECSGGVWQRRSATEGSKGDGVLCTQQNVNMLDFRLPSGVALRMPSLYGDTQCVYANGDSIFTGVRVGRLGLGSHVQHEVVQWSLRQAKPIHYYSNPGFAAAESLRQVWGSMDTVMAADSNGLFVFKAEGTGAQQECPDVIGASASGLLLPTFDYSSSRILLISRDRPASWCHWPK